MSLSNQLSCVSEDPDGFEEERADFSHLGRMLHGELLPREQFQR